MTRSMARTRLRLVACAGAAALAAGLGAAAGPAATAAPPAVAKPDLPDEVLDQYLEIYPDVPAEVLYERLALSAPRKRLLERFGTEHAATFGGSWYDYRQGVWNLLATNSAAAEAMAAQGRAAGVAVRTRVVRYSYSQLQQRASRIRAGKDPLSKVSRRAGFDVVTNRVEVVVPPSRQATPDPMVTYVAPTKELPKTEDACSNRRDCGAPLRTGIILWRGSYSNPKCSLGFAATATNGSKWVYTAGHCIAALNETWGHGEQVIGTAFQCGREGPSPAGCYENQDVDVARIGVSSTYWKSQPFGYIFASPTSTVDVDYAIQSRITIEVGDVVCVHGWHKNNTGFPADHSLGYGVVSPDTCGGIYDVAGEWGMPMVGNNATPCGGDSGGGWTYYPGNGERWAYGLHKNAYKDSGQLCGNGTGAWFSTVPEVNAFFDARSFSDIRIDTR